jgi:hypothetical protein
MPSGCVTFNTGSNGNKLGFGTVPLTAEYCPINDAGAQIGAFQVLFSGVFPYGSASPIRDSRKVDVAPGRYAVRFRRDDAAFTTDQGTNAVLWAGLRAFLLLYMLIIRPILKQQPMLSAAFKAEASLWDQLQAKLTGFRTKLSARLLAIAGFLVGFHDEVLPIVTGQDWTSLTSKLPAWSIPVGLVLIAWLFEKLRQLTENPPHVIMQKDDADVPKVVAIEKQAG